MLEILKTVTIFIKTICAIIFAFNSHSILTKKYENIEDKINTFITCCLAFMFLQLLEI